jgi:hypothetical protein
VDVGVTGQQNSDGFGVAFLGCVYQCLVIPGVDIGARLQKNLDRPRLPGEGGTFQGRIIIGMNICPAVDQCVKHVGAPCFRCLHQVFLKI